MVLEDTIRRINYRLAGREVRNIKGVGKFRTLKFVCELATSSGESFKDGSEFYLWISDDLNKIPLYLESPIRIGSVRVRLLDASNLKYPLTSKNQIGGSAGRYGLPCNGNGPSFPTRQRAVCREAAPETKSAPANGTARQKCTDFAGSGPGHPDERQKGTNRSGITAPEREKSHKTAAKGSNLTAFCYLCTIIYRSLFCLRTLSESFERWTTTTTTTSRITIRAITRGYDRDTAATRRSRPRRKKSIKGLKIMIVILAVILGALSVLYFTQVKQMQADYAEARDTLTARLTMMLANYDTLSTENDTLAQHLTTERFKADSLLETLKNERVLTRRKIKDYEKRLGYMRTVMEGYIHQIDSLNTLNQKLVNENITYRKQITSARLRADKAEEKAQELSTKVQKGAVIRARDIALVALNRSDKVVSRAARAELAPRGLRAGGQRTRSRANATFMPASSARTATCWPTGATPRSTTRAT